MIDPKQVTLVRIAESFPRKRAKAKALAKALEPVWREGEIRPLRTLDVGTHQGILAYLLLENARLISGSEFSWLDPSRDDLRIAERFLSGNFIVNTFEQLLPELPSARFDLVTAFDSIMYVSDLDRSIEGVLRILSPGGAWVVSGVESTRRKWWLSKLESALGLSEASGFRWNPSLPEMEARLNRAGFIIESSVHYFGLFSYLFQMVLDFLVVRGGKRPPQKVGRSDRHDRRTSDVETAAPYLKTPSLAMKGALSCIRFVASLSSTLDSLFGSRFSGGWVIRARNPGSQK